MASKRVRESSDSDGQPLIQVYYAKKPKDNASLTPSVSCERQPEILLPTRVDPATLPNPMPKTATGHSIKKMWFEDYSWLQLAKNMRSLYCGSSHWAVQNHRLGPSDMNTCSNTTFPWKNMEVGYENIKKGRMGSGNTAKVLYIEMQNVPSTVPEIWQHIESWFTTMLRKKFLSIEQH